MTQRERFGASAAPADVDRRLALLGWIGSDLGDDYRRTDTASSVSRH